MPRAWRSPPTTCYIEPQHLLLSLLNQGRQRHRLALLARAGVNVRAAQGCAYQGASIACPRSKARAARSAPRAT